MAVRAKVNAVLFAMFFGHAISVFGILSSHLDFKATCTVLVGDDFAIQNHELEFISNRRFQPCGGSVSRGKIDTLR